MKKVYFSMILLSSLFIVAFSVQAEVKSKSAEATEGVFWIYKDAKSPQNHYTPSGWMGDYGDLRIRDRWTQHPLSGETCIQIQYSARGKNGAGWAGIYWQRFPNNWGRMSEGYNLTGYKKLKFWVRGENGSEVIKEFKVGGIEGEYPDSASVIIGPIELSKEWKEHEINLEGKDLTRIMGGFCWIATAKDNPNGFVIYFDDIRFEK